MASSTSATKQLTGRTEFFVVCGSTNAKYDVWQFADFFAIIREFRSNFGFSGTAWNTFPYEQYFKFHSGGKHLNEIWFGHERPAHIGNPTVRTNPALRFKRGDPIQWTNIDADAVPNLDKKVLQHIEQRSLQAGDRFNIVLICHGDKSGNFLVGNQILIRQELVESLNKFKPGVQVNVIVAACWSGHILEQMQLIGKKHQYVQTSTGKEKSYGFSKRVPSDPLRGSPFVASIIKSMPDWHGARPKTLGEHIDFVQREGIHPSRPNTIPQAYTNVDLHEAIIEVMYTHYIHYDASKSSGPRTSLIINPGYPSPSSTFGPTFLSEQAPAAGRIAYEVIKSELQITQGRELDSDPKDYGFLTLMQTAVAARDHDLDTRLSHLKTMLDGLKWRFEMQARFIEIWQELIKSGLLSMECVMRRMDLVSPFKSDAVFTITQVIDLFDYARDLEHNSCGRTERCPKDSLRGSFEEPIYWLAILIVRCATVNVIPLFSWLASSKLLGDFLTQDNAGALKRMMEMDIMDEDEVQYVGCPAFSEPQLEDYRIGFILPHGQNIRDWARQTNERYKNLKNAYEGMVGAGSWEDNPRFVNTLHELSQWVPPEFQTVLKSKDEEERARK